MKLNIGFQISKSETSKRSSQLKFVKFRWTRHGKKSTRAERKHFAFVKILTQNRNSSSIVCRVSVTTPSFTKHESYGFAWKPSLSRSEHFSQLFACFWQPKVTSVSIESYSISSVIINGNTGGLWSLSCKLFAQWKSGHNN